MPLNFADLRRARSVLKLLGKAVMGIRASLRVLLAVAALAIVLGDATAARAQTIGTISTITRKFGQRDPQHQPFWISRQDCLNDDVITFNFPVTLTGTIELQVWAGQTSADCTQSALRTQIVSTAPQCWAVYDTTLANSIYVSAPISVRDIVGQHGPTSTGATGVTSGPAVIHGTQADCTSGTISPPIGITLFFMLVVGNAAPLATTTWTQTSIDLWGPSAPTGVTGGSGETRIHLDWTRSVDTDLIRYDFYCDPAPGALLDASTQPGSDGSATKLSLLPPVPGLRPFAFDGGIGGATGTGGVSAAGGATAAGGAGGTSATGGGGGTAGSGGAPSLDGSVGPVTDAGTAATGSTCNTSSILVPGVVPDDSYASHKCGSVDGISASSGTATGLTNGIQYTVAVVGVDGVFNPGPFSGQVCATPQEVTDFFELYRQAGGKAGGGFCSLARPGRGPRGTAFALGGLAVALVLRRRTRRA